MKALVIARANMVRALRDRLGLFFIVLLPLILIVVLGLTYGGWSSARVGVVNQDGSALAGDLVTGIKGSTVDLKIDIRTYGTPAALQDAVQRGFVEIGLVIPAGYGDALSGGQAAKVEYVTQAASGVGGAMKAALDRAVASQVEAVRAARFAASQTGTSFTEALAAARTNRGLVAGVQISEESVVEQGPSVSGFTVGAQSQVILFVFLTSLTGAVELIVTRQLGISRRMLATPTGMWTIIAGEGLGRVIFALFQGFFIVIASALLFGVQWGDPLATSAIVAIFALVAAGAAMLIGAVAANPSQAGALGPALGLFLGLLGGTMVPADVFPKAMQTIAHITPHAWAMDAFRKMLLDNAGIVQVLPQLGVLVGFAAVLFGLAAFRFQRLMATGGT
jgi:ABC-2 type transport system permease protein